MLRRFYELRKEIKVAMVELEQEFEFSDDELKKINAFSPMEMTVQYLCKDKADLLLTENVVMFTLKKLRHLDTKISKALQEKFQIRVQERQNTELIHLLKYLRSSNYLDEYQDHFGNKISKTKITALAISLLKRLYPQSPYNQENFEGELVTTKSGQPDQAPKVMTLFEEFVLFFESENHEFEVISAQEESRSKIVKKEMSLFEATKKRDLKILRSCITHC